MLNGKFFTGLPPKMIDRRAGATQNRLESHLFWPDESNVDSALETRVKRRNSMQLVANERPRYEKQMSVGPNEVDTKKRFSKEFSQSSIQFHDNLNDDRKSRHSRLFQNAVGTKKRDIAEKPTSTKLQLPESVVDAAYTTAKKSQAYSSTIQFYDYVNEEEPQNNRNNLRKPKMDMNNKREMELNRKNSPKLQVKRDVRSLSEEKDTRKINNREVKPRSTVVKETKQVNNNREQDLAPEEELYLQNTRSVKARTNISPKRSVVYSSEREIYREPERVVYERRPLAKESNYIQFENPDEYVNYKRESVEPQFYANRKLAQGHFDNSDDSFYRKVEPKRILKITARPSQYEPRPDYREQEEEISNRIRTVRLKSPPRKHYYQPEEEYYETEEPQRYYHNNSDQVRTPTSRGSSQRHFETVDKVERVIEVELPYEYNDNNKLINNQVEYKKYKTPSSPSPPPSAQHSAVNATDMTTSATKSQKHLRSSLCFNDGAIIAENDATRSPTSQYSTQRRNVRSLATQRVSVGLPE